jgi:hypothetical protein
MVPPGRVFRKTGALVREKGTLGPLQREGGWRCIPELREERKSDGRVHLEAEFQGRVEGHLLPRLWATKVCGQCDCLSGGETIMLLACAQQREKRVIFWQSKLAEASR